MYFRNPLLILTASLLLCSCNGQKWTSEECDMFVRIAQRGGQTLAYSPGSGLQIITEKGFAFKDLNRNGSLDVYEDWRRKPVERARDLASRLSIEEIAGLMLNSTHQRVPTDQWGWWPSTYDGMPYHYDAGLPAWAVSDTQKFYMSDYHIRGFLMANIESPEVGARWCNSLQAFAESLPFGIPVNVCSDPRHETEARAEYNAGSGGTISLWPPEIGLAATFDPSVAYRFGQVMAAEFRALGLVTTLSPQTDLATEPRWNRFYGTFGEDPQLVADMSRAYIDGCQTSPRGQRVDKGWGHASINAMAKHWPGGGPEEGGRDAHYSWGKYCVYPGNNLEQSIYAFDKGALHLDGPTAATAAIMPYYTISYGQDPSGENVGNGFSRYLINDVLRGRFGYDGVVCTDWGIVLPYEGLGWSNGRPWGLESLDADHLHYRVLLAGVDQFGGADDPRPVLGAYRLWCEEFGEESAQARFRESAARLLLVMFRTGLFENPYVDIEKSIATIGCGRFMDEGFDAQRKSVIMIKNHGGCLPRGAGEKVFVPRRNDGSFCTDTAIVARYCKVVEDPAEADFAIAFVTAPSTGDGYSAEDREAGGTGYVPVSLQYEPYTAEHARELSMAGGDPLENFTNRSFRGKSVECGNRGELDVVARAREAMGDKPVVTVVSFLNPFVPESLENLSDAILLLPWVQHQAGMDMIFGACEPSGLLPMQLPADMRTVEEQFEDVPRDMRCYVDVDGNTYDFAFGLDWNGVIDDNRVKKYR